VNPLHSVEERTFLQQKIDRDVLAITTTILENIGQDEMLMRAKRFIYFINHNTLAHMFRQCTFKPKIEDQTINN
jgi:hypothetical protein